MHTHSFFRSWWRGRRLAAAWLRVSLTLTLLGMAFQQAAPAAMAATIFSCDAAGLQAALNAGGDAIFNCPSPGGATVTLTGALAVTKNTNLDGSNLLTISTNGTNRIFLVNTGVTLGLTNLTLQNGNDTYQGGGVYNLGTLNVSNTTFTGNTAGSGGAIYNAGTLSVTGSTFYTNTAGSYGAAIFNAGSMALSGGTFSGNTTPVYGGAIYNDISGSLTAGNSTTFYRNSAGTGGAIYNYGSLALDTVIFSRNTVTQTGGGLYNTGSSNITISNTQFILNNAGTGAGFYTAGPATLTNATFMNNIATNSGGGLFTSAALTIAGTSFTSNNAVFAGGGISTTAGSSLSIGTSSFYSNTAINGGGINTAGVLNLSATTFSGNGASSFGGGLYNGGQATIDSGQFRLNTSSGSGGGIYSTAPVTLTNSAFDRNTANYGGAVANLSTQSIQTGTFTLNTAQLEGGSIYNNGNLTITASGFYTGTSSQYGGAIQNFGSVAMSGITFAGNTATTSGGAVYLARNGRATIDTTTFSGNTATNDSGGGIYLFTGSSLSGSGLSFNGNTAALGGAVRSVAASTITISNSVFTGNQTTSGVGAQGGAFRTDGVTALDTITLTANFGQDGGGIYNGGITTIANSRFISNTTNGGGAAINNTTGSRLSVDQSLFTLNSSANNAGALYNNGIFTLTNSTLLGNRTQNSGGAAMNDSSGTLVIGNVAFYTNTATTANGGAIYNNGGLNVTNGGFSGNTAVRGGGLYQNSNSATIGSSTFSGNSASQFGGAIASNATLTISYTDFYSNTASDRGGAIYNHNTLAINADGTNRNEIRSNSATNYGGAIFNDANLTIDYTNLFNNTVSTYDGGAIYSPGNLTVRNSTLNSNGATRNGGAILAGGPLTVDNDTLNSNAATNGNGGAIYNDNPNTSTISNSSFNSNTANNGNGGAVYNNRGTLTLSSSAPVGTYSLANNHAANGGAIGNAGTTSLNINNYLLSGNTAGSGGAISNTGDLNVTTTTFSQNQAQTGNGGAIISLKGTLTFSNTTFSSNTAQGNGGGLDTNGSTVTFNNSQLTSNTAGTAGGALGIGASTVTLNNSNAASNSSSGSGGFAVVYGTLNLTNNTTVKDNHATANGGAIENNATVNVNSGTVLDGNKADQNGGAIHNNSTATINNARIVNNAAATGGGIANGGTATVMTTTLANNTATNTGAAIANTGGALTVLGSTFNDNTAQNGPGGGLYMDSGSGGVNITNSTFTRNHANPNGAGVANASTTVTPTLNFVTIMNNFGITNGVSISGGAILKNSIIWYANGPADCNAPIVSQGDNVKPASCGPTVLNDTASPPENNPLNDNGGPTQTISQSYSSSAFDRVQGNNCDPMFDQRGFPRGRVAGCMSGAYEIGAVAPFITSINPTSAYVGNYPNGPFTLDVYGGNFDVYSTQIIWNGTPITTNRFAGDVHLSAAITPDMIAAAGTYTVSVTNNHPEYPPPGSYKTFTVNQVPQMVYFPATFPGSIPATSPPFDVQAQAKDNFSYYTGQPVTFTITGSNPPCTVGAATYNAGDGYYHATVTITGVINNNIQCMIQATASGNITFASGTANQMITIKKVDQKVTLSGVPTTTKLINDPPFVISATSIIAASPTVTTGLAITLTTNDANICTVAQGGMDANGVTTGTVSITGGGTCQIIANQPGNGFYNANSNTGSFTIQKLSQTLSGLDPIPDKIATDPPFAITTTSSSGLQPNFTATGFCTVGQVILLDNNTTQARVTITGGNGTCTITAQQPGNNIYNPSNTLSQTFAISKANQTLSFNLPSQYTLEQSSYTFTATATSGLTVTFTTAGDCTIDNNASRVITGGVTLATLNLTGEGSCSITAVQSGNTFYNSSNTVTNDISIGRASQSISFLPLDDKLTTDPPFVVSATATSGLPVTFTVSGNCTASGTNGSTITITGAGSCTVTAHQAGNAQYSPALNFSQGFLIGKASQTIDFAPIPDKTAADPPFVLTATASSGLPVTYSTSGSCVVSGTLASITGTGTCSITAAQTGNQTYTAASKIQTFVIIQSNQTITFPVQSDHLASEPPFPITATASSGLTITFTANGACTVSPGTLGANKTTSATVGITGTGSCTLTAQQAGTVTYTAAAPVARTFNIAQASQSITFDPIGTKTYTETTFSITATASSGLQVTFSAAGGICSAGAGTLSLSGVTTTTVTISAPGSCTITASQAGNITYTAASPVSQTFSVTGFTQTISFDSLPPKSFGDPAFPITATASSGLTVTFATNTGVCVVSNAQLSPNTAPSATVALLTLVAGGSCVITATQPGNFQYFAASPVSQTVPIGKVAQQITFNRPPDKQVGDPDFPVTATVNSGLVASFTAGGACTIQSQSNANNITTAIIHITGGGSCTITASQPGNNIWAPAPDVSYTIGIGLLSQTIDFPPIPNKYVGDPPFVITATTNYSLPVAFTATGQCSVPAGTLQPNGVTSSTVTITGAGTCTITANAAGDANHAAASPVQRSFTINKLSQTIDFPPISDRPASQQHFTITATATSGLTVTFQSTGVCTVAPSTLNGGVSSAEVTLTGSGSCSITAQQAGNANYAAAPDVTRSFNSNGVSQAITFNPLPDRMLGDSPFTVSASASSGLPVTFTASGPCNVSGNTVTLTGGGRCTITAHQAGNGIFPPAADVSQSFLIFSTQIYVPVTMRSMGSGW